jgi:hypothetical protein
MSVPLSRWPAEWREASMSRSVLLDCTCWNPEVCSWASREANLAGTPRCTIRVCCNAPCHLRRSLCRESYGWSALLLLSPRKLDSLDRTLGIRFGLGWRASGKQGRTRLLSLPAEANSTGSLHRHQHLHCPRCASRTVPVPHRGPSQSQRTARQSTAA